MPTVVAFNPQCNCTLNEARHVANVLAKFGVVVESIAACQVTLGPVAANFVTEDDLLQIPGITRDTPCWLHFNLQGAPDPQEAASYVRTLKQGAINLLMMIYATLNPGSQPGLWVGWIAQNVPDVRTAMCNVIESKAKQAA
jgi:hypothetical protein